MASPIKRATKKQKQALEQQQQQQIQQKEKERKTTSVHSQQDPKSTSDDLSAKQASKKLDLNQIDEKLRRKKLGEYEIIEPQQESSAGNTISILDMFDQKYSCPFLSVHESYDIFYSSGKQFDFDENYNADYDQMFIYDQDVEAPHSMSRKQMLKKNFKLNALTEYDENNVCRNVMKRLYLKSKSNLNEVTNDKSATPSHLKKNENAENMPKK